MGSAVPARKISRKRGRGRQVEVAPSERFVWGMAILMVALVGIIVLEALYIVVTRSVSTELIAIISALIGSLSTAFLMGKRQ